jgi:uncharacterized membrane protein
MSEPTVPPPPPAAPAGDTSNRTLMLVLSYVGLLALIPLLVEKDDKEVQWHAKHGLVQVGLWIVVSMVFMVLSFIPFLGCITSIIFIFVPLAALALSVISIIKAVNGQRFIIPGISDFADKF